jgi:hypothetical protein
LKRKIKMKKLCTVQTRMRKSRVGAPWADRPPENVQRREVDHRWWEPIPGWIDLLKTFRDGKLTSADGSLFHGG